MECQAVAAVVVFLLLFRAAAAGTGEGGHPECMEADLAALIARSCRERYEGAGCCKAIGLPQGNRCLCSVAGNKRINMSISMLSTFYLECHIKPTQDLRKVCHQLNAESVEGGQAQRDKRSTSNLWVVATLAAVLVVLTVIILGILAYMMRKFRTLGYELHHFRLAVASSTVPAGSHGAQPAECSISVSSPAALLAPEILQCGPHPECSMPSPAEGGQTADRGPAEAAQTDRRPAPARGADTEPDVQEVLKRTIKPSTAFGRDYYNDTHPPRR